jgi:hypothetical protein
MISFIPVHALILKQVPMLPHLVLSIILLWIIYLKRCCAVLIRNTLSPFFQFNYHWNEINVCLLVFPAVLNMVLVN